MSNQQPTGTRALSLLPFVVMAVTAIADIAAGPTVGLLPLVALGPAFAGLTGGPRRTALIGGPALVLCLALGWYDDLFPGRRGTTALVSVAGVTAAGLVAAVMRRRREAELASVRSGRGRGPAPTRVVRLGGRRHAVGPYDGDEADHGERQKQHHRPDESPQQCARPFDPARSHSPRRVVDHSDQVPRSHGGTASPPQPGPDGSAVLVADRAVVVAHRFGQGSGQDGMAFQDREGVPLPGHHHDAVRALVGQQLDGPDDLRAGAA